MFDNIESFKDNQENSLITDRIASVFNKSESIKSNDMHSPDNILVRNSKQFNNQTLIQTITIDNAESVFNNKYNLETKIEHDLENEAVNLSGTLINDLSTKQAKNSGSDIKELGQDKLIKINQLINSTKDCALTIDKSKRSIKDKISKRQNLTPTTKRTNQVADKKSSSPLRLSANKVSTEKAPIFQELDISSSSKLKDLAKSFKVGETLQAEFYSLQKRLDKILSADKTIKTINKSKQSSEVVNLVAKQNIEMLKFFEIFNKFNSVMEQGSQITASNLSEVKNQREKSSIALVKPLINLKREQQSLEKKLEKSVNPEYLSQIDKEIEELNIQVTFLTNENKKIKQEYSKVEKLASSKHLEEIVAELNKKNNECALLKKNNEILAEKIEKNKQTIKDYSEELAKKQVLLAKLEDLASQLDKNYAARLEERKTMPATCVTKQIANTSEKPQVLPAISRQQHSSVDKSQESILKSHIVGTKSRNMKSVNSNCTESSSKGKSMVSKTIVSNSSVKKVQYKLKNTRQMQEIANSKVSTIKEKSQIKQTDQPLKIEEPNDNKPLKFIINPLVELSDSSIEILKSRISSLQVMNKNLKNKCEFETKKADQTKKQYEQKKEELMNTLKQRKEYLESIMKEGEKYNIKYQRNDCLKIESNAGKNEEIIMEETEIRNNISQMQDEFFSKLGSDSNGKANIENISRHESKIKLEEESKETENIEVIKKKSILDQEKPNESLYRIDEKNSGPSLMSEDQLLKDTEANQVISPEIKKKYSLSQFSIKSIKSNDVLSQKSKTQVITLSNNLDDLKLDSRKNFDNLDTNANFDDTSNQNMIIKVTEDENISKVEKTEENLDADVQEKVVSAYEIYQANNINEKLSFRNDNYQEYQDNEENKAVISDKVEANFENEIQNDQLRPPTTASDKMIFVDNYKIDAAAMSFQEIDLASNKESYKENFDIEDGFDKHSHTKEKSIKSNKSLISSNFSKMQSMKINENEASIKNTTEEMANQSLKDNSDIKERVESSNHIISQMEGSQPKSGNDSKDSRNRGRKRVEVIDELENIDL